jgi:hypothetical protein
MKMLFSEYLALEDQRAHEALLAEIAASGLSEDQVNTGLDAIKLGLDAWGFEQTTGWIGDLLSAAISGGQSAWHWFKGNPEASKQYGVDAAVSLVSAVPFGDVAKLIKARHGPKYARKFIQVARLAKTKAKEKKIDRMGQRSQEFVPGSTIPGMFGL